MRSTDRCRSRVAPRCIGASAAFPEYCQAAYISRNTCQLSPIAPAADRRPQRTSLAQTPAQTRPPLVRKQDIWHNRSRCGTLLAHNQPRYSMGYRGRDCIDRKHTGGPLRSERQCQIAWYSSGENANNAHTVGPSTVEIFIAHAPLSPYRSSNWLHRRHTGRSPVGRRFRLRRNATLRGTTRLAAAILTRIGLRRINGILPRGNGGNRMGPGDNVRGYHGRVLGNRAATRTVDVCQLAYRRRRWMHALFRRFDGWVRGHQQPYRRRRLPFPGPAQAVFRSSPLDPGNRGRRLARIGSVLGILRLAGRGQRTYRMASFLKSRLTRRAGCPGPGGLSCGPAMTPEVPCRANPKTAQP